ncbi:hypothetical protein MIDIC_420006 [Alphaproteobacteria bacterium]
MGSKKRNWYKPNAHQNNILHLSLPDKISVTTIDSLLARPCIPSARVLKEI